MMEMSYLSISFTVSISRSSMSTCFFWLKMKGVNIALFALLTSLSYCGWTLHWRQGTSPPRWSCDSWVGCSRTWRSNRDFLSKNAQNYLIVTSLNWPDWSRKSKSVESFSGQILLLGFGFGWVGYHNDRPERKSILVDESSPTWLVMRVNLDLTWACPDCWTSFPSIVISQSTVNWNIVVAFFKWFYQGNLPCHREWSGCSAGPTGAGWTVKVLNALQSMKRDCS